MLLLLLLLSLVPNVSALAPLHLDPVEYLERDLAQSVDPCDDFYEYTCRHFGKSPQGHFHGHVGAASRVNEDLMEVIEEALKKGAGGMKEPLVKMYVTQIKQCLRDVFQGPTEETRGLFLTSPCGRIVAKITCNIATCSESAT